MAFSSETVKSAWYRAGGRCQCTRLTHMHVGPCGALLMWANRGREGRGAWEANHRARVESGGSDALSNCEILCWECHRLTF
jgi:5-methylcytosine-specific restriction endonuclease McrA